MFVAKVTGSLVATQKVASMVGHKLLVVEPYRIDPQDRGRLVTTGRTFVAVDTVGAGEGRIRADHPGSSARLTPETKNLPIDTVIIGIVDTVHVDQTVRVSPGRGADVDDGHGTTNDPLSRIGDSPAAELLSRPLANTDFTHASHRRTDSQRRRTSPARGWAPPAPPTQWPRLRGPPRRVHLRRRGRGRRDRRLRAAFSSRSIEDRKRIIDHIRRISIEQCVELGTMEMEETKIGRLAHKIEKLKTLGERTPGVEFMRSEVFSGDHGLAVIEHAPFGVIGAITPVTHSLPTITGNAVSMIAGGNTLVVNPHPSGQAGGGRGRAPLQRGDLPRPGHRQPDLRDRRADARIGRRRSSSIAA